MKKAQLYSRASLVAFLMLAVVPAEAADVKELFATNLADYPGKEGRMLEVSYPPGARDLVHRHDAHVFVYVLEGQIVMQVKGQPAVTLKAGQTFYEGPTDVHVVGRNAIGGLGPFSADPGGHRSSSTRVALNVKSFEGSLIHELP
jgi:quercetin dioxygenase-like cupin family protein